MKRNLALVFPRIIVRQLHQSVEYIGGHVFAAHLLACARAAALTGGRGPNTQSIHTNTTKYCTENNSVAKKKVSFPSLTLPVKHRSVLLPPKDRQRSVRPQNDSSPKNCFFGQRLFASLFFFFLFASFLWVQRSRTASVNPFRPPGKGKQKGEGDTDLFQTVAKNYLYRLDSPFSGPMLPAPSWGILSSSYCSKGTDT